MIHDGLFLLIIINPFSQMVYLSSLMQESSKKVFFLIYFYATFMAFTICILFALLGEYLLFDVFQVSLSAMRIFGGILILSVAYKYIISGPEGLKLFHGDVTEIAQQIMLPLMVGPGVIWMCVKIGETYTGLTAAIIIGLALVINSVSVLIYFLFLQGCEGSCINCDAQVFRDRDATERLHDGSSQC